MKGFLFGKRDLIGRVNSGEMPTVNKIISLLLSIILLFGAGCASIENEEALVEETPTPRNLTPIAFNESVTIPETVLYDKDGVLIRAKGIEYYEYGFNVLIYAENNNSEDFYFYIDLGHCYVNDCSITSGWDYAYTIPADTAVSERCPVDYYYNPELLLFNITDIYELQLAVSIGVEEIYTTVIKTSVANRYDCADCTSESIEKNLSYYGYEILYGDTSGYVLDDGLTVPSAYLLRDDDDILIAILIRNNGECQNRVSLGELYLNDILCIDLFYITDEIVFPGMVRAYIVSLSGVSGWFNSDSDDQQSIASLDDVYEVSFQLKELELSGKETNMILDFEMPIPGRVMPIESSFEAGTTVYEKDGICLNYLGISESDDLNMEFAIKNIGDTSKIVTGVPGTVLLNGITTEEVRFYSVRVSSDEIVAVQMNIEDAVQDKLHIHTADDIEQAAFTIRVMTEDWVEIDETQLCWLTRPY